MNINQMKSAIAMFRKADLSVIKDEKLRNKAKNLQGKEKGFTLLELLVVITLIAILATGALIAYEDVGESAEAASAGNAAATIDRAVRTYRAVENVYPNQWDNLVDTDGNFLSFAPTVTGNFLNAWTAPVSGTDAEFENVINAFVNAGIEEIQVVTGGAEPGPDDAPNRFHNESSGSAVEAELEEDGELPTGLAVVPSSTCPTGIGIPDLPSTTANGDTVNGNELQNAFGDALEDDECHLVVALGFGGDAAASTTFSNVAIAQSPTYVRTTGNDETSVNPETEYARYIGLFQVGEFADQNDDDNLTAADDAWEWNENIRLIAIVSTDGKNIDQLNSEAQQ